MKDLKEMLDKKMKKEDGKDDMGKEAKLTALKDLRNVASGMMGEGLKGMMEPKKAVTVAADSKEDLMKGLEKAKELLPEMEEDEVEESPEEEDAEMSEIEQLKKQVEELKAMLAKK